MSNNILNPFEKELLIRLYRSNPDIRLSDFCRANSVSEAAFKTWLKKYDAEGLSGLYRSKKARACFPTAWTRRRRACAASSSRPGSSWSD